MQRNYRITKARSTVITATADTLTMRNNFGTELHLQKVDEGVALQLGDKAVVLGSAEVQHLRDLLA